MAAPGIGYVKRDVDKTTIDWSAVSSSITGALGEAFTESQKQRAEVELKNQKMAADIQDLPAGATPDQSKYYASIIQNIGDANQKIKQQYDDGDISANQYKIATNSLNTQYQILKNNLLNYQSSYDKLLERINKKGTGNLSIFLGNLQQIQGDLANRSIDWNPETMILESKTIVDGNLNTQPVTNDLAIMNFYNKKFDMGIVDKADSILGKFSTTTTKDGVTTRTINYKGKDFNESLDGIVNAAISDPNGIQALEYLSGPGGKTLVWDTPKNDDEIQVLIDNATKKPIAANLSEVVEKAKKRLRQQIIGSLDMTFSQTPSRSSTKSTSEKDNAFYEMTYLPNVKAVEDYEEKLKTVKANNPGMPNNLVRLTSINPIVDRLKQVSDENIKFASVAEYDNKVNEDLIKQFNEENITQSELNEEYIKSPDSVSFYIKKPGKDPEPYTMQSTEQMLNFLNEISGISPQKRADFAKKYLQSSGKTEKTVNYSNK